MAQKENGGRELRHRGGEDGRNGGHAISEAALAHAGDHADREADGGGEEQRKAAEDAGIAEPRPQHIADRRLETDGLAQVADDDGGEPVEIAADRWLVRAVLPQPEEGLLLPGVRYTQPR